MNAKLSALAGLALALLAAPAQAQNCSGGPFSGAYIGGSLGFGRSDITITSPDDPKLNAHDTSFAFGGLAGYNVQCGNIVLGVAGDLSYLGLESNSKWTDPNLAELKDKIDWFGTVRGVLGATIAPDTMVYVTGGLAFADVSHDLNLLTLQGAPAFNGFHQKDSGWATGYVIGGGINFLRHGNWMINAEMLYVDLGSEKREYNVTVGCPAVNCTDTAKWDDSFLVGRLGVSYKFGPEPVAYTPMK